MPPKPTSSQGYSVANDEWGLLGLPPAIVEGGNSTDNRRVIVSGFDLNNLGLPLNMPEDLHTTFSSPWTENAPRVQPELKLPASYVVSPPALRFTMFQKFQLETLFYVFYSMPRDVLQLAAAQELYSRDWRYHKEAKFWLTRAPGQEPVKQGAGERGSYVFWNPEKWCKERKDNFLLQYEHLEENPAQSQHAAAAAQQQAQVANQQAAANQQQQQQQAAQQQQH